MEDSIYGFLKSGLEGDIIRVLSMFGGTLWKEEIVNEVYAMNKTLGEVHTENFDEAISNLQKAGVINIEERFKGDLREENVRDILVTLTEWNKTVSIVFHDEKYRRYQDIRRRFFEINLK